MDAKIGQLQELLAKLPGIGPRQARRFVYFFLKIPSPMLDQMFGLIQELRASRNICDFCQKIHFVQGPLCEICSNKNRHQEQVLVVAKNSDLEAIEKSGVWNGRYFVLGRTLRVLEKNPEQIINLTPLVTASQSGSVNEIVFGLPVNPEGEHTERFVIDAVRDLPVTISRMGRGLSTGSELEYADPATIKSALENRK